MVQFLFTSFCWLVGLRARSTVERDPEPKILDSVFNVTFTEFSSVITILDICHFFSQLRMFFKRKSKQSSLDLNISLNGYFKPEYTFDNSQEAEKVLLDPMQDKAEDRMYTDGETPPIAMKDGRVLVEGPLTEESAAAIFHKKGFCLFPHQTKVETWNEDYIKGMVFGSDISRIYASELEAIIRNELLPDYHIVSVDVPPAVLKRGPKSKNNFYGSGVHQDYALTLQDYKCSVDAYDPTGFAVPGFEKKYEGTRTVVTTIATV